MKKFFRFISFLSLVCLFCSCTKKHNFSLACNYYELALLELSEKPVTFFRLKRALAFLDTALGHCQDARTHALKATILFKLSHFQEADKSFKSALALVSSSQIRDDIKNNYACLLAELNKCREAVQLWDEIVQSTTYLTPEIAFMNKGCMFLKKGMIRQAEESFLKAVEFDPQYIDARLMLIKIYKEYRYDLCAIQQHAKAALFIDPKNKYAQLG